MTFVVSVMAPVEDFNKSPNALEKVFIMGKGKTKRGRVR